jgi:predicted RNase H-like HicB family nuclease
MDLTVVVHQEHEGFWSQVNELPGCLATGRTLEELGEALGEAVGLYLWDVPAAVPGVPLSVGESKISITPP